MSYRNGDVETKERADTRVRQQMPRLLLSFLSSLLHARARFACARAAGVATLDLGAAW